MPVPASARKFIAICFLFHGTMSSSVCQACNNLVGVGRKTGYINIYRRALEGCPGCSILLAAVLHFAGPGKRNITQLQLLPNKHPATETSPLVLKSTAPMGWSLPLSFFADCHQCLDHSRDNNPTR